MLQRQVVSLLIAALASVTHATAAEVFRESFDAGTTSWRTEYDPKTFRALRHERQSKVLHEGTGAESLQCLTASAGVPVRFLHSLKPAIAIEDLTLSVWVRSSEPGHMLLMRLVFPDETDPETGQPLRALIPGSKYTTANQWQQLTCRCTADAVRNALIRTRSRLGGAAGSISAEGLYVDQAVISGTGGVKAGPIEFVFDELSFGPIIEPAKPNELLSASIEMSVPDPPVEFRLNRLTVEGQPFFPRMGTLYAETDEAVGAFADTGLNTAWIMDYRRNELLQRLKDMGLWATAIPPRAEDEATGEILDAREAGIVPFGQESRPILFWNLGPRIPEYALDQLIDWVGQIHSADRAFDRPTLADVTDGEYAFSNHVDMVAVSRHITHTGIPYEHYRDWLKSRRSEAFLNTFFWTWVQTEPAAQAVKTRAAAGNLPLVLEPEQLRLQVYAAMQAGCRGIGYWNTIPYEAEGVGTEERRLAMARLNLELQLLEPLLATGGHPNEPFSFRFKPDRPGSDGHRVRPSYHRLTMIGPEAADTPFAPDEGPVGQADAVVIKTDLGPLLLAVCYGDRAQFCPGQMAANDVKIVVPGVDQTAAAWLISPAGVEHLPDPRVTGGREITFKKFDTTAAVLFTSDQNVIRRLATIASNMTPRAAEVTLRLAKLKRERVAAIHRQLMEIADPVRDAPAILRSADREIAAAEAALSQQDFAGALRAADDALQALRNLQRVHWIDAVEGFNSPLASPHAVCFSTLPDHYRLINKVGGSIMNPSEESNLLPSGSFEDKALLAEEWRLVPFDSPRIVAGGAMDPKAAKRGSYGVQLVVRRRDAKPIDSTAGSVKLISPSIPVRAGQILHISGWVRVPGQPIAAEADGATLHDNLLGPSAGLRWTKTKGWEQFEMLREVPEDGNYELTLALQGEGEVHFDDVRVIPHDPRYPIAEQPGRFPPR